MKYAQHRLAALLARAGTVLMLLPMPAAGQTAAAVAPPARPCALAGRVLDPGGMPVAAARIDVAGTALTGTTDKSGAFCISGPLPDPVRVTVTADRFGVQTWDAGATRAGTLTIDITLTPPLTATVTVSGRADTLVGVAASASEGTVGASELAARPVLRSADLLEAVPGVAMTQHSTGGHAPLILLRGYNLDHGTDFATFLEGVPLNFPSHAHAQGYTDLNFLMTELVDRLTFDKGPYKASVGNFGTAGASTIEMMNTLESPIGAFEIGGFSQVRAMTAASRRVPGGTLLGGVDLSHTDGPSVHPDNFRRARAMLRYARGDAARGVTVSFFGYGAAWNGSDGYPARAVTQGWIPRHGSLDTTDGGRTNRYLVLAESRWVGSRSLTRIMAYGQQYGLDLFSNLTFNTRDAILGDQIHQRDRRVTVGGAIVHERATTWAGRAVEVAGGLQVRYETGSNALFNTHARAPVSKMDDAGTVFPAVAFDEAFNEGTAGPWAEARLRLNRWVRTTVGLRADIYRFAVAAGGSAVDGLLSPKAGVVVGPWARTEFYVNAGRGFHSNNAFGVVENGATPLVRTAGAEVGVRTAMVKHLQSSVSVWAIDSDSELLYRPEEGVTRASRPGRRHGVEWLNYWQPRPWLAVDADIAVSQARFRTDPDGVGLLLPDAIAGVYSMGVTVTDTAKWSGSLRGRYLGSRALTPDGGIRSTPSFTLNCQVSRAFGRRWTFTLEAFNLLDRSYDDITYYFATRLRNPVSGQLEAGAANDFVTHPAEPRSVRIRLVARF